MFVDQLTEELALVYGFYEHESVMTVGKRTYVYSCVVCSVSLSITLPLILIRIAPCFTAVGSST